MGQALKCLINVISAIRKSEHLFVIPGGTHNDFMASGKIIDSWLVKLISLAYKLKGLAVPGESRHPSLEGSRPCEWQQAECLKLSARQLRGHQNINIHSLMTVEFGGGILASVFLVRIEECVALSLRCFG